MGTTIVELIDREENTKIILAVECIQRFIEITDSMEASSLMKLESALVNLVAQSSDKEDDKFIQAAIVYTRYVAKQNK